MYPIIQITEEPEYSENMGTKEKFWYDGKNTLFKQSTAGTGEHWGEKAACELCALLEIPHAHYDIAVFNGNIGVTTDNIVPKGSRLVLGNELLAQVHANYPTNTKYRVTAHNLRRIHALMVHAEPAWQLPSGNKLAGIEKAFELFIGYLMLDALIANQDRHHENWGVISMPNGTIYLAPTFDHAACLGQNEIDKNRHARLNSKDKGYHISYYIEKAKTPIYGNKPKTGEKYKPLSTLEAFRKAAQLSPRAGQIWINKLRQTSGHECRQILEQLPPVAGVTDVAVEFAAQMLELNRKRLLTVKNDL
jgi:hypothetical protein